MTVLFGLSLAIEILASFSFVNSALAWWRYRTEVTTRVLWMSCVAVCYPVVVLGFAPTSTDSLGHGPVLRALDAFFYVAYLLLYPLSVLVLAFACGALVISWRVLRNQGILTDPREG